MGTPPASLSPFELGNALEAGLWWTMAAVIAGWVLYRRRGMAMGLAIAAVLAAFGASDVVEMRTGAWWRPWWLLVWKGTCLAALLGMALVQIRGRKRPPA
jgi:hypothetical protein